MLNPRSLAIKVKNGCTLPQIAADEGMSITGLEDFIYEIYPTAKAAKKIIRALKSNEHIVHKTSVANDTDVQADNNTAEDININVIEPISVQEVEETSSTTLETAIATSITAHVEACKVEIQSTEAMLNTLELQHKQYEADRDAVKAEIEKCDAELMKLRQRLVKLREELRQHLTRFNELGAAMEDLNPKIGELRQVRDALYQESEALQSVDLYVFENSISICDTVLTEFPGWKEIYHELITSDKADEFLDDLTGRQVKVLAKVISVTNELKARNIRFDLLFESEVMKSAYHELVG